MSGHPQSDHDPAYPDVAAGIDALSNRVTELEAALAKVPWKLHTCVEIDHERELVFGRGSRGWTFWVDVESRERVLLKDAAIEVKLEGLRHLPTLLARMRERYDERLALLREGNYLLDQVDQIVKGYNTTEGA